MTLLVSGKSGLESVSTHSNRIEWSSTGRGGFRECSHDSVYIAQLSPALSPGNCADLLEAWAIQSTRKPFAARDLANIKTPFLLIQPGASLVFPAAMAYKLQGELGGPSEVVVLEGTSHIRVHSIW